MPAAITFALSLAPLPVNFNGTPQEFGTALVDRITITPSEPWSSFITGSVIPVSDTGPLLFNSGSGNKEWRVWDTNTGLYTYLVVNGAGIVAGSIPISKLATDLPHAKSVFALDQLGVPLFIGGSTGQYLTMGANGPQFTSVASTTFAPARATGAAPQTLAIDTVLHKILAVSELFDPQAVYDAANSRYIAPTTGIYAVFASAQVDNAGGVAAQMELAFGTSVNANPALPARLGGGVSVASPPGSRWYPHFSGLMQLTAGDQLEIYMSASDGTNASNVTVTAVTFCVSRIQ